MTLESETESATNEVAVLEEIDTSVWLVLIGCLCFSLLFLPDFYPEESLRLALGGYSGFCVVFGVMDVLNKIKADITPLTTVGVLVALIVSIIALVIGCGRILVVTNVPLFLF